MDAFWNFMTVTVTLGAALVPVGWAWHYDRFRKSLDSHEHWVAWISALRAEVTHQFASLEEMDTGFRQILERQQFGVVTKRFNDDLFKSARVQIITHPRSPHVFPLLTRTFRDTAHTNAMLDRYEAAVLRRDFVDANSIGSSVLGSLQGVRATLEAIQNSLELECSLFPSIEPKLYTPQ